MIVKNSKGFTLIEIVTVVVVLGILGAFTFSFINHTVTTYVTGKKQRMLYQEASYIMERITRELRDAYYAEYYTTSSYEYLYMYKSHRSTSPMSDSDYVYFYLVKTGTNSNALYRYYWDWSVWTWRSSLIGGNVTRLIMTPSSVSSCNSIATVNLVMQDGDQSFTLNTSVTPKNYADSNYNNRCFYDNYEDVIQ